jgi:hypothetical protein
MSTVVRLMTPGALAGPLYAAAGVGPLAVCAAVLVAAAVPATLQRSREPSAVSHR